MSDQTAMPSHRSGSSSEGVRVRGVFRAKQVWPSFVLALFSLVLAGLGLAVMPGLAGMVFLGAGLTVLMAAVISLLTDWVLSRRSQTLTHAAMALTADDPAPWFCVTAEGLIECQNRAAEARFGTVSGQSIDDLLAGYLINPGAVMARLEQGLAHGGNAQESVFTRNGHIQLTSFRMGTYVIWRMEDVADGGALQWQGMSLPMLMISGTGAVLSVNEALVQMLGKRPASVSDVFGDVFGEVAPIPGNTNVELKGSLGPVPARIMTLPGHDGLQEIYVFPTMLDTGAHDDNRVMFEALPVAALWVCPDGRVEQLNEAARKLLRVEPEQTNLNIGDLIEGPGRLAKDWMRDLMEERAHNRIEVVRMLRGADERSVKIATSPVNGKDGPRMLAVLQDATEVQDLQTQFAQSQKMQAIGELAGGVAHDFNNLLTAIAGHCDLLLLRHDQGDQDYADLVQIHQNANRAASLVGQLLAFSRKQTMKPELLDLRDTMADLTHLLNRLVGERVTLELRQDPTLQPIRADRRMLDQVLMNLVVNARDAMPDGGPITITSGMARLDEGLQRNNVHVPPGNYVKIEVVDRGIGISADGLSRIFEPFYTTKDVGEGTGLGLSMAYGIMKQSGGYIFCDSTEGEGTVFSLIFPAHDWPAEGVTPDDATSDADQQTAVRKDSGVILLVEDEAPVRAFASRALRLKGYSVLEAENGEEALDLLEDYELEIDVFVTDMIMPGKGGPDWVREALVTRPHVGVVFTSGYAEDAYGKFPDIPQADFLAKPFSLAELTETVRQKMV